jgi:hypothetical protein
LTAYLCATCGVRFAPSTEPLGACPIHPNLVPLPDAAVQAIGAAHEPYAFDRIHGAWWGSVVTEDGTAVVRRSVERHARAVRGEL